MTKLVKPSTGAQMYFLCPCGDDTRYRYDHLGAGRKGGPWYCDTCFVGWWVHIDEAGAPTLEDRGHRMRKLVSRIRLQPQQTPVDFIVTSMAFRDDGVKPEVDDLSDCVYFFEEHQCASNIMRDVQEVVVGDDDDPHGLFEYVESFELPDDE